jgi:hypothetical protein
MSLAGASGKHVTRVTWQGDVVDGGLHDSKQMDRAIWRRRRAKVIGAFTSPMNERQRRETLDRELVARSE